MMRLVWPGATVFRPMRPAGMSSITSRTAGAPADASFTSSWRTAYPSMAELSRGGLS